ncbi:hypothetical protein AHF37_11786 [Paragonimus kellicotti]|nr:hypothetical protein AHF37_11786 [Paragonimus kellicotti]
MSFFLLALCTGINIPFNIKTVHMLLAMFDRDFSGRIEFHEFSDLYNYITQWKQCFERFDTDRSGTIDSGELHTALATFGYRLSPSFINRMISRFDRTHRGVIAFDDFIQALVCLQVSDLMFFSLNFLRSMGKLCSHGFKSSDNVHSLAKSL